MGRVNREKAATFGKIRGTGGDFRFGFGKKNCWNSSRPAGRWTRPT